MIDIELHDIHESYTCHDHKSQSLPHGHPLRRDLQLLIVQDVAQRLFQALFEAREGLRRLIAVVLPGDVRVDVAGAVRLPEDHA